MKEPTPVLLTNERVQRFVADGFIVFDTGLSSELHQSIARDLHHSLKDEYRWLGDNLLPRVPQLEEVLSSQRVLGAMHSLLGPDFTWAPHRFPHNSEPLDRDARPKSFDPFENGPKMGKGSISGSGWHQDGHSKAGRSRWHTFKAINMFYFPHDVPLEMGPTRLLAGSHLYASLRNLVPSQVFFNPIKAGTVVIADFDVGHAGSPNCTENSRYMLKFVALRMSNPTQPTWDFSGDSWSTPQSLLTPDSVPNAWNLLWKWLQGRTLPDSTATKASINVAQLIHQMEADDHSTRLRAMYQLVELGSEAVEPLTQLLTTKAGQDRHESPAKDDPGFYAMSPDHSERRFSRRQFVPEDCAIALGLIGKASLPSLTPLLTHTDPWLRINAAYAIGEVGDAVPQEIADQVGVLLEDDLHQVIRAAADALCWINFGQDTLRRLRAAFIRECPAWEDNAMGEPGLGGRWTIQNQIRYGLAWALRSQSNKPKQFESEYEDVLLELLPLESGYTPAVICQALEQQNSVRCLRAAIEYLQTRRWDAFSFDPKKTRIAA